MSSSTVEALRDEYKELYGTHARGPKCMSAAWLRDQINAKKAARGPLARIEEGLIPSSTGLASRVQNPMVLGEPAAEDENAQDGLDLDDNCTYSANDIRLRLKKMQQQTFFQNKEALNLRQQKLLQWVKEDQGLIKLNSPKELSVALSTGLGVTPSESMIELLTRAEDLIVARTRQYEMDPSNEFCGGCFMSHSQGTSGPQVMLLKQRMEKACPRLKGRIWYDKDNTPTEEGMRLGIKACPVFVLFLSTDTLRRPFVRKEIRWAIYYRKKLVLLWERDGHNAVTEFHTFKLHTKEELDGESASDIDVIFNDNVAIPYYSRGMFSDVSLALILRNCGYENDGAELLRGPRISVSRKMRVHVLFCEANGFSQAEAARLLLEAICPSLRGRCCVSNEVQLVASSHVLIYVTVGVFSEPLVIDVIRQATDIKCPITCLVELDLRHGGVMLGENFVLPVAAIGSAPMDILQPLNNATIIPFHKDSEFRKVSLRNVLAALQHRASTVQSASTSGFDITADYFAVDVKRRNPKWLKMVGLLLIILLLCLTFMYLRPDTKNTSVSVPSPHDRSGTECASMPCHNGGSCAVAANTYTCACMSGWSGAHCDELVTVGDGDYCSPNPCNNYGTCAHASNNQGGFRCYCIVGYSGPTCTTDACLPSPCDHGGSCAHVSRGAGYECACVAGFMGFTCATDICASSPCGHDGECIGGDASYSCT
eukprot:SAG22_NODE_1889_length_3373_cov_2.935247_2_plen_710_part_00